MTQSVRGASQLDDALVSFLRGDSVARSDFAAAFYPTVRRWATDQTRRHQRLRDLDLADDVADRFWELLLSKDASAFDPGRASASTYLGLVLRQAVRDVIAEHTPVGSRTRAGHQLSPLSLEAPAAATTDGFATLGETVVDQASDLSAVDDQLHVAAILATASESAPPHVVSALWQIYSSEDGLGVIAADVGLNRFKLGHAPDVTVRHNQCVARVDRMDIQKG